MTDPNRTPQEPFGPGWGEASERSPVDWGRSADLPPPPKRTRNASIVTGSVAVFFLCVLAYEVATGEEWGWGRVLMVVSQGGLSILLFRQYRQAIAERDPA